MPKFTIVRAGQKISETTASGERIELGSARTCAVYIDDLLIALKQAAFVRSKAGEPFHLEPLSRLPALKMDGVAVEGVVPVRDGATIQVEGYEVRIQYLPGELAVAGGVPSAEALSPREPEIARDLPLPPPLEPELPPPLDLAEAESPLRQPMGRESPLPTPPISSDREKTVFVQRIGKLVAIGGPLRGQQWDLAIGETRIGRDPAQNHIVVRLDAQGGVDNSISRRHASIHVVGNQVFVEDQHSAAGTFIAGRQLPPGERVAIKNQDVIEIRSAKESTLLRLELPGVAAPQPSALPREPLREPVRERPVETPRYREEPIPVGEDEGDRERMAGRRRRRPGRTDYDENPFVPMEGTRGRGSLPRWVWIVVAVVAVLVVGTLLVLAL
ncbi:MAG: FHA domain-containing protein [Candidatus Zixiibacteriota bacterium]